MDIVYSKTIVHEPKMVKQSHRYRHIQARLTVEAATCRVTSNTFGKQQYQSLIKLRQRATPETPEGMEELGSERDQIYM